LAPAAPLVCPVLSGCCPDTAERVGWAGGSRDEFNPLVANFGGQAETAHRTASLGLAQ